MLSRSNACQLNVGSVNLGVMRQNGTMKIHWLETPLACEGKIVSAPIGTDQTLLPLKSDIRFRAHLVFNAFQAYACDGRQLDFEAFDKMERFEKAICDEEITESKLLELVEQFDSVIPPFVYDGSNEIPARALVWSRDAVTNA